MDKKKPSSTIDKKEYFETLNKIIFFITNAQTLANKINIKNLFDRVNEENLKKRVKERNTKIYCSIFHKDNSLQLLRVYEVDPNKMYNILVKKYKNSSSTSRHVGLSEEEIIKIGAKLIYPKNKS